MPITSLRMKSSPILHELGDLPVGEVFTISGMAPDQLYGKAEMPENHTIYPDYCMTYNFYTGKLCAFPTDVKVVIQDVKIKSKLSYATLDAEV